MDTDQKIEDLQRQINELRSSLDLTINYDQRELIKDVILEDRDLVTAVNVTTSVPSGGGTVNAPVPMTGWIIENFKGKKILVPYKNG